MRRRLRDWPEPAAPRTRRTLRHRIPWPMRQLGRVGEHRSPSTASLPPFASPDIARQTVYTSNACAAAAFYGSFATKTRFLNQSRARTRTGTPSLRVVIGKFVQVREGAQSRSWL